MLKRAWALVLIFTAIGGGIPSYLTQAALYRMGAAASGALDGLGNFEPNKCRMHWSTAYICGGFVTWDRKPIATQKDVQFITVISPSGPLEGPTKIERYEGGGSRTSWKMAVPAGSRSNNGVPVAIIGIILAIFGMLAGAKAGGQIAGRLGWRKIIKKKKPPKSSTQKSGENSANLPKEGSLSTTTIIVLIFFSFAGFFLPFYPTTVTGFNTGSIASEWIIGYGTFRPSQCSRHWSLAKACTGIVVWDDNRISSHKGPEMITVFSRNDLTSTIRVEKHLGSSQGNIIPAGSQSSIAWLLIPIGFIGSIAGTYAGFFGALLLREYLNKRKIPKENS